MRLSVRLLPLLAAAIAIPAVAADDKWEITTSFEMTGMPFQMPPQTTQVCLPQNQPVNEKMVPAKDNCKVSGFTTSGNTSRFHVECAAPEQMSGDGEFTRLGADAYKGTMKMRGNMDGRMTDMKMAYSGRKAGSCGGAPTAGPAYPAGMGGAYNPAQMQQQMMGQQNMMCGQMADGMAWQMAASLESMCPTIRADICARAKAQFDVPKNFIAFQEQRPDWKDIATYCGIDPGALATKACATAKSARNWNDAVLTCGMADAELLATAKKQCAGFELSSSRSKLDSNTRLLCDAFADQLPKPQAVAAKSTAAEKMNNVSEAVDTGAAAVDTGQRAVDTYKKFKGMFGR